MTKEKRKGRIPLALAVNTAAFVFGCLGGFFLTGWLTGRGWLTLSDWLESYATGLSIQRPTGVSFWAVLWDTIRWPLFVTLLGYTALGVWMVPTMFALRGFFLCFCVAALSGAGQGGFWLALILLGLGGLIELPAFFLLGTHSWTQATTQKRLAALPTDWGGGYLARTCIILGCVAGCAWIESLAIPGILRALAPLLSGAG